MPKVWKIHKDNNKRAINEDLFLSSVKATMIFFLIIWPDDYHQGSVVFNGKCLWVLRPLLLLNHSLGLCNNILDQPIVETVLRKNKGYSSLSMPKETNKSKALTNEPPPPHPTDQMKFLPSLNIKPLGLLTPFSIHTQSYVSVCFSGVGGEFRNTAWNWKILCGMWRTR